jgi:hypothetical protein
MTTAEIVKANNKRLTDALIPTDKEPIFCNSFLDPNDEVYLQSLESLTIIKTL